MSLSRMLTLACALLVGGVGVSHVVIAVGQDLKATASEMAAKKEAERTRKQLARIEKQRKADEERNARRAAAAKELAERRANYDFYEKLGEPWPVPVEANAYGTTATVVAVASKPIHVDNQPTLQAAMREGKVIGAR